MTANVFYTCSDSYAPYAGISMLSLFVNNKHIENIRVFVVGDNVSAQNIARFQRQAEAYGRKFVYIDGSPYIEQMKKMNLPTYRNVYAPNLRLFFSDWVEDSVERLLYLDCDTIVCGDVSELFSIDMGENCVAVVRDSLGARYKKIIGFDKITPYFNAGVLLFDIRHWISGNWGKKLFDNMKNYNNNHPNTDQDYLNITLKGHIYLLPPKYNFQPVHKVYANSVYYSCYSKTEYYSDEELNEARKTPIIIHTYRYLGQFPWHRKNWHPFRQLYVEYKGISEWKELRDLENHFSLAIKIERILYRLFPQKFFLKLFSDIQLYMYSKSEKKIRSKKV